MGCEHIRILVLFLLSFLIIIIFLVATQIAFATAVGSRPCRIGRVTSHDASAR